MGVWIIILGFKFEKGIGTSRQKAVGLFASERLIEKLIQNPGRSVDWLSVTAVGFG